MINSKSKIFFSVLFCFVFGISIASFLAIKSWVISLTALCSVILLAVFIYQKRDLRIKAAPVFLIIICMGILRCNSEFKVSEKSVLHLSDNQKHQISAIVIEEPEERSGRANLTIKPDEFSGYILVKTNLYPEYFYGDKILIKGKIQIPEDSEEFSWRGYLLRENIQAVSFYPEIKIIEKGGGSGIYAAILSLRRLAGQKISKFVSGAEADFISALILGHKGGISAFWKDVFSRTGTSHIVSISGLHISIISGMLLMFLLEIGFSRVKAFWVTAAGLAFYIVLIGFSPSAVRAGIMGFLALLAVYAGRIKNPRNALMFAAALMLLFNPLLLRYDVGFQLSFLSVAGIFYLWPVLEKWTENFPNPAKLKSALNLSLSAQIITMPLTAYYFKSISLIAPAANLLVVPFVPFAVGLSAVPLFAGFLPEFILRFLFAPAKEISGLILLFLKWLATLPVFAVRINWVCVIAFYLILCLAVKFGSHFSLSFLKPKNKK